MKAMILAAGRGSRLAPLTDDVPKPLIEVCGKPLIVWHLEKLAKSGFSDVLINIDHLGQRIIDYVGDGAHLGLNVYYSDERKSGRLETAGAIKKASHWLGEAPFLLINADVYCGFTYVSDFQLDETRWGHLLLIENPSYRAEGDFGFSLAGRHLNGGQLTRPQHCPYTYSGIGYYRASMLDGLPEGKQALGPWLISHCDRYSAEVLTADDHWWMDVGTLERLKLANAMCGHN